MSTPRFSPLAQCVGKRTFGSKKAAKRYHRRALTVHGGGEALDAYRCPHCGWFHLGHKGPHIVEAERGAK